MGTQIDTPEQGLAHVLWKRPGGKYFGPVRSVMAPHSAFVTDQQPQGRLIMNGCGHAPIKLDLWMLKFGFHTLFTCHKVLFFLPFKNAKSTGSLRREQKPHLGPRVEVCCLPAPKRRQVLEVASWQR